MSFKNILEILISLFWTCDIITFVFRKSGSHTQETSKLGPEL